MRVDFYHLTKNKNRHAFLCKLLEKANAQESNVTIHCESEQQAQELDDLLWTYSDEVFLPHSILDENYIDAPIQINFEPDILEHSHQDILVCLTDELPTKHSSFKRIIHIIADDKQQQATEQHKQHYAAQQFQIHEHSL